MTATRTGSLPVSFPLGRTGSMPTCGKRPKLEVSEPAKSKNADLHQKDGKVLHPDLLNEDVVKTQYAVRGEIYLRSEQLRTEGMDILPTNGKRLAQTPSMYRKHAHLQHPVVCCNNGKCKLHLSNLPLPCNPPHTQP